MTRRLALKHGMGALAASVALPLMAFFTPSAQGSEADFLIPEEFAKPVKIHLDARAEKKAEAIVGYLQALFEEEYEGPDKALESKRRVLFFDPEFTALAVEIAQHHLRRGQVPEAISVLKDAAKGSPHNTAPILALSAIYLRQLQKPALAEKFALQSLSANPDEALAYSILCEIYSTTGQFQKIDPLLQKASKRENTNYEFWLGLAEIRFRDLVRTRPKSGDAGVSKVISLLEKASKLASENPTAQAQVADFYVLCGEPQKAADLYKKAMANRPDQELLREKLATCLVQCGQSADAIKILEDVLKKNPLNLSAYDNLARIHLELNHMAAALANMRQALILAPIDPRRHEDIIRVSFRSGDTDAALAFATEAEKKFPYLVGFTLFRAIALSQKKQFSAALLAFERTLVDASNSNPEMLDSEFFMSYGSTAEQAGLHKKAAELLQRAIVLDPMNAAASNYLGYMWADLGQNLTEAERLVQHALRIDPENAAYRDSLGWVWFKQGRYTEALAELLRAAETISSPDPVIFEHIGDTYEKLGKIAEAVMNWNKALQFDSNNAALTTKIDRHSARVVQKPNLDSAGKANP